METSTQQLNRFFLACENLMNEKYNVADSRIAEVLKSIAESRALTDLFSAVTERFDYPSAKKTYLRFPATAGSFHGKAMLPKDRGEVIAFVFCLLVDMDAGRIKLDDFLLRYFYEDGSYTASYALFTERMLRPFHDIVKDCFPEIARNAQQPERKEKEDSTSFEQIAALAIEERERLVGLNLPSSEAGAGDAILCEVVQTAGKGNLGALKALLIGYRYFLRALSIEGGDELLNAVLNLE